MRQWSQDQPTTSGDLECSIFDVVWKAAARYYGTNHYRIGPNYERVLGMMTELASWLSPRPFGNPITETIRDHEPVVALEWLRESSDKFAGRKRILSEQTFLFDKLAGHMRDLSNRLDRETSELIDYGEFFRKLRDRFELGIYNLNYDTVATSTWPEVYCGFDRNGNFDPLRVTQRRDWGFIYHLHGSVHHCITGYPGRIVWRDDLNGSFTDRQVLVPDMAQDFRPVPLTTLIVGGPKLDQVLINPYQTFYSAFVKHVREADAFLIAGYGFGDPHVNRTLRNRFEGSDGNTVKPKVVVLDKSPHDNPQTAYRQSHDFWAYELARTLNTRFQVTQAHIDGELRVGSIIENGAFETDNSGRIGIWHGGFLEAFSEAEAITEWLRGG